MMQNYKLTVDLKMDSHKTAAIFAQVLAKTMELTASTAIDMSEADSARITLGKTTIESADSFTPN